jgi:hypothetical protein
MHPIAPNFQIWIRQPNFEQCEGMVTSICNNSTIIDDTVSSLTPAITLPLIEPLHEVDGQMLCPLSVDPRIGEHEAQSWASVLSFSLSDTQIRSLEGYPLQRGAEKCTPPVTWTTNENNGQRTSSSQSNLNHLSLKYPRLLQRIRPICPVASTSYLTAACTWCRSLVLLRMHWKAWEEELHSFYVKRLKDSKSSEESNSVNEN